jgi:hypothetical protein
MTLQPILLERALPERGVLWLYPESGGGDDSAEKEDDNSLMQLHRRQLELAFPACLDLSQKGDHEKFRPHVTLSHFENLQGAEEAQARLEKFTMQDLDFVMDRFYLLRRQGLIASNRMNRSQYWFAHHSAGFSPKSSRIRVRLFSNHCCIPPKSVTTSMASLKVTSSTSKFFRHASWTPSKNTPDLLP